MDRGTKRREDEGDEEDEEDDEEEEKPVKRTIEIEEKADREKPDQGGPLA